MQAVARVFASRRAYESAQRAARRGQGPFVRNGSVRQLPGPLGAWTSARDLPPVAQQSFRDWWRSTHPTIVRAMADARERDPRPDPRGAG